MHQYIFLLHHIRYVWQEHIFSPVLLLRGIRNTFGVGIKKPEFRNTFSQHQRPRIPLGGWIYNNQTSSHPLCRIRINERCSGLFPLFSLLILAWVAVASRPFRITVTFVGNGGLLNVFCKFDLVAIGQKLFKQMFVELLALKCHICFLLIGSSLVKHFGNMIFRKSLLAIEP